MKRNRTKLRVTGIILCGAGVSSGFIGLETFGLAVLILR
jgi:hypothetical protein